MDDLLDFSSCWIQRVFFRKNRETILVFGVFQGIMHRGFASLLMSIRIFHKTLFICFRMSYGGRGFSIKMEIAKEVSVFVTFMTLKWHVLIVDGSIPLKVSTS